MNIADRTYIVAGVTRDKDGVVKVRYSGDDVKTREHLYKYLGATETVFIELPCPMNKVEICNHLLAHTEKFGKFEKEIRSELAKKQALVAPKVPGKRGPKPKAKVVGAAASKPKPAKPAKAPKAKVPMPVPPRAAKKPATEVETLVIDEYPDDSFDLSEFEALAKAANSYE